MNSNKYLYFFQVYNFSSRHEVPGEHVLVLREQLLTQVASFADGPRAVLTQLCVAVSLYLLLKQNQSKNIHQLEKTALQYFQYLSIIQ